MREIHGAQAMSKAPIKRGQRRPQPSIRRAPREKMRLCHQKAARGSWLSDLQNSEKSPCVPSRPPLVGPGPTAPTEQDQGP